ncbi:ATP-binding protein [Methanocalculus sp.]|uniref:AAA family ATPase n=1 Tax=Methanocalculus sp. TaxID=2004547 RepID=UPI002604E0CA|nr:ATP-binding protein [Methanocalculus sp.]MDG6250976.1 ATP-binding protein [Methanocalculus sp.]
MLIEYSVENFRSISEKTTFSMVPSKERKKAENLIRVDGVTGVTKLLKSAVIFGANASGKTNQIRALDLMQFIVRMSRNFNKGDKIPYFPFILNSEYAEKPTTFSLNFIIDETEYRYSFSYNADEIISEELVYFKGKSEKTIFIRNQNDLQAYQDDDEQQGLFRHTGNNVLFLSKANNEYKPFGPAFKWFNENLNYLDSIMDIGDRYTINYMNRSQENKDKIINLLNFADFDIHDVSGTIKTLKRTDIPDIVIQFIEKDTKKPLPDGAIMTSELKSVHTRDDGHQITNTFSEFESAGTRIFFNLLGLFLDAFENRQKILIIDEFDTRLHPDLISYIFRLFHSNKINRMNSQLIVTTHNTRLLSSDLFRREQIWFTEKKKQTRNTDLYSLFDYEKRLDRSIEKNYFSGRYGGVPDIMERGL